MSDNIVSPKSRFGDVVMNSKCYDGFDMYTALEEISFRLAIMRLLAETMLESTDGPGAMYQKAVDDGRVPDEFPALGHAVNLRCYLLLGEVVYIENLLKQFDIHPS